MLFVGGILLASGAVFAWGYYGFYWPVGEGPAGPGVERAPFERVWSERSVLLLGLGDSVTAGLGSQPGKSYFELLANSPADDWADVRGLSLSRVLPNLRAINRSRSGTNSLHHWRQQIEPLETFDANVFGIVVMTSGGNDIIHDYCAERPREGAMYGATLEQAREWIANYERRLEAMIARIEASFPGGCVIFLANIYDFSDGRGVPWIPFVDVDPWDDALAIHAEYNAAIARLAAGHGNVHMVDMYSAFLGHGIGCRRWWTEHYRKDDPHFWYLHNFEDPNPRGYDALRRLFLNEMARVLPDAIHRAKDE